MQSEELTFAPGGQSSKTALVLSPSVEDQR